MDCDKHLDTVLTSLDSNNKKEISKPTSRLTSIDSFMDNIVIDKYSTDSRSVAYTPINRLPPCNKIIICNLEASTSHERCFGLTASQGRRVRTFDDKVLFFVNERCF